VLDNIRIDKAEGEGTFRGTLTLHGQKREVVGSTSVQKKDGQVRVSAAFPLKVSDFQIPKPTYLGIGVRDEVQVKVSVRDHRGDDGRTPLTVLTAETRELESRSSIRPADQRTIRQRLSGNASC
jgi:hypothetical protein